jgi:predicted alpha/beta superfamily hydrolase
LLREGAQALARAFGSGVDIPVQRSGEIETLPAIHSAFVSAREVQVWLPPGYREAPQRRYPVLYLHDGQNVFDARAAGAEWQVDEHAQRGVLQGALQPMIIVAVASNGDRMTDYAPVAQPRPEGGKVGGGAEAYARYLIGELKPAIDHRYRTQPGREHTAVGGSSMGGLVSMWLLLAHGDSFGAALVVSPSVWWAGRDILGRVAAAPAATPAPRIWLDVGGREDPGMVDGARRLRDALRARGWAPAYLEEPAGGHDEASWAARVPAMLDFLYGTR